jgi:hypothetical protein
LQNEEFHNLYYPNIIKTMKSRGRRWAGHAAHMGRQFFFVGNPEGKRALGILRRRQDNMKRALKEIGERM